LVREINRCADGSSVHGSLHYFSGNGLPAIGSLPEQTMEIKGKFYKNLRASSAPSLIYEQSHDNETLIQSHGFKH
jgi:glycogen debranching enzyme